MLAFIFSRFWLDFGAVFGPIGGTLKVTQRTLLQGTLLQRPARPRSGRARAEAIVWASCLHARAALVTLALLLLVALARLLLLLSAALASLASLAMPDALSPLALPVTR